MICKRIMRQGVRQAGSAILKIADAKAYSQDSSEQAKISPEGAAVASHCSAFFVSLPMSSTPTAVFSPAFSV